MNREHPAKIGTDPRQGQIKKRRVFRNDGRPSSRKWIDHERGIAVSFMPKLGGKRGTVPVVVNVRASDAGSDGVECRVCGVSLHALASHINRVHLMNATEYRVIYGQDAPMLSRDVALANAEHMRTEATKRHVARRHPCPGCGEVFQPPKRATQFVLFA